MALCQHRKGGEDIKHGNRARPPLVSGTRVRAPFQTTRTKQLIFNTVSPVHQRSETVSFILFELRGNKALCIYQGFVCE